MKIIDEKGKLFGLINIIDFLVAVFLLFCLASILYFSYKIRRPKESKEPQAEAMGKTTQEHKEYIELDLNCVLIKVKPENAKLISVGDADFDEKGKKIAEITSVGEVSPYIYVINIGAAKMLEKYVPSLKQVPVTLKVKAGIKDNNIYYKGSQILHNGIIEFKTDKYTAQAKVIFDKKLEKYDISENLSYPYRTDVGADKTKIDAIVVFKDGSSKKCKLLPQYDPPVVLFEDEVPSKFEGVVLPAEFPSDIQRGMEILYSNIYAITDRLGELEHQMDKYVIKGLKKEDK